MPARSSAGCMAVRVCGGPATGESERERVRRVMNPAGHRSVHEALLPNTTARCVLTDPVRDPADILLLYRGRGKGEGGKGKGEPLTWMLLAACDQRGLLQQLWPLPPGLQPHRDAAPAGRQRPPAGILHRACGPGQPASPAQQLAGSCTCVAFLTPNRSGAARGRDPMEEPFP